MRKRLPVVILSWAILCSGFIAGSQAVSNPSIESRSNDGADKFQSGVVAALDGPIMLTGGSTRLTLEQPAAKNAQTLAARITALEPGHHLYLVLKDLRVKQQPGILYRIYLDLPANAKPGQRDPHYVGRLNFYGAAESAEVRSANTSNATFFSFDITASLRILQNQKLLSDDTTVTIMPSGAPAAGSDARIGRVEIVEQ